MNWVRITGALCICALSSRKRTKLIPVMDSNFKHWLWRDFFLHRELSDFTGVWDVLQLPARRLQRCHSETEAMIKSAVHMLAEEPDLIADCSKVRMHAGKVCSLHWTTGWVQANCKDAFTSVPLWENQLWKATEKWNSLWLRQGEPVYKQTVPTALHRKKNTSQL